MRSIKSWLIIFHNRNQIKLVYKLWVPKTAEETAKVYCSIKCNYAKPIVRCQKRCRFIPVGKSLFNEGCSTLRGHLAMRNADFCIVLLTDDRFSISYRPSLFLLSRAFVSFCFRLKIEPSQTRSSFL